MHDVGPDRANRAGDEATRFDEREAGADGPSNPRRGGSVDVVAWQGERYHVDFTLGSRSGEWTFSPCRHRDGMPQRDLGGGKLQDRTLRATQDRRVVDVQDAK